VKTQKRRSDRIGRLVFFIPMIIIISLVLYGFFRVTAPGTLEVEAQGQNQYQPSTQPPSLHAPVIVTGPSGTQTVTTPDSLSVATGTYTVTYGPVRWYTAPANRTVAVPNGLTVYAVGVYQVTPSVVDITKSGFNTTQAAALHGVTPVIWVNNAGSSMVLTIASNGSYDLASGQNLTKIFQGSGTFDYSLGSGSSGVLQVT
jgi:hypothetical protein